VKLELPIKLDIATREALVVLVSILALLAVVASGIAWLRSDRLGSPTYLMFAGAGVSAITLGVVTWISPGLGIVILLLALLTVMAVTLVAGESRARSHTTLLRTLSASVEAIQKKLDEHGS
jgi:hypothetical protein